MNATLELAAPHLLKVEAHHWDRPVSQHAQTRHGDLAATEPKPATGGSRHPRPLRTAALWAPERSCGPLEPRSVAWSLCEAPPKVADSAALYPPPQAQTAGFHILRIEEPKAQLKVNGCGVVPRSERGKASQ